MKNLGEDELQNIKTAQRVLIGIGAAAAMAGAAHAQDSSEAPSSTPSPASSWAYFEGEGGLMQAGVQTADGEQLILKCDEPGDGKVFAVIFTPSRLKPPSMRAQLRPVRMRFDDGSVKEDSWRYREQTAMALNARRDHSLPPFLNNLADANNFEVVLEPVDGSPIEINFHVTGARDAIARIYESCGDGDNPLN